MRLRDFPDLNFSSAFYCAIDLCFFFFPIRPPQHDLPLPYHDKACEPLGRPLDVIRVACNSDRRYLQVVAEPEFMKREHKI